MVDVRPGGVSESWKQSDNEKELAIVHRWVIDRELLDSEYHSGCPLRHKLFDCEFIIASSRKFTQACTPVHKVYRGRSSTSYPSSSMRESASSGSPFVSSSARSSSKPSSSTFCLTSSFSGSLFMLTLCHKVSISGKNPYFLCLYVAHRPITCI